MIKEYNKVFFGFMKSGKFKNKESEYGNTFFCKEIKSWKLIFDYFINTLKVLMKEDIEKKI